MATKHFTYSDSVEAQVLQQGDVLAKTPKLLEIIGKIHPHYLNDTYTYFIILTQSCDLVPRKGEKCKASYITLACVRPLPLALEREMAAHQDVVFLQAGICAENKKNILSEVLRKILDNNHPDYFYLHPSPNNGFFDRSCAFLRLSIAIRAGEHYKTCLEARVLSLDQVFQAKLGWLVGNIYSRVGTPDWVPNNITQADHDKMIKDLIQESFAWYPTEQLKAVRSEIQQNTSITKEEIIKIVNSAKYEDKKEKVLGSLIKLVRQIANNQNLSDEEIKRVLLSHSVFKTIAG